MRKVLLLLSCCVLSCQQQSAKKVAVAAAMETPSYISGNKSRHHIVEKFDIGDINSDDIKDTATVSFDFDFDTNTLACPTPNCTINVSFGPGIPDLDIDQTLGIFVKTAPDLNRDGADDILLFSRTYEGNWNAISACSLLNGEWVELAQTKCFFTDDPDAENRIVKIKNRYYLVGDSWNDRGGGVMERSVKVPINRIK